MIYVPTHTELSTIANRLNLPTIPPVKFLSALINLYTAFCDAEYEDILNDIEAEYLTYKPPHYIKYTARDTNEEIYPYNIQSFWGYLVYDDGSYTTFETIV